MRLESLVVGVVVLGFGLVLVSTNGVLLGVSLPGLVGLPSCSSGKVANATPGFTPGCGIYSVGTVVSLFGLGLIANGLRAPSAPRGLGSSGAPALPPELAATLEQARQSMAGARGPVPGTRYCPNCGRPNPAEGRFCSACGATMPPVPTPPTAPGAPSPGTTPKS